MDNLKLTPKMARVIKIFLQDPTQARYGFQLMRLTGLPSGTLYPVLARFEEAGWITGGREDIEPHTEGRPRRRTYTISGEAVSAARAQLAALSDEFRPPAAPQAALRPREAR